ncbi:MAG: SDR family NAD(P)-dependent oxidoreductase, partial [Candidatus Methylomirabilales bacterium]
MGERVAVITGGARGIGRAIALSLAESGWPVTICYRTSAREAGETVEAIRAKGGRGQAVVCDVSDAKAAEGMIRQVEKEWGRVDALINCAGPYHRVELLEETVEG